MARVVHSIIFDVLEDEVSKDQVLCSISPIQSDSRPLLENELSLFTNCFDIETKMQRCLPVHVLKDWQLETLTLGSFKEISCWEVCLRLIHSAVMSSWHVVCLEFSRARVKVTLVFGRAGKRVQQSATDWEDVKRESNLLLIIFFDEIEVRIVDRLFHDQPVEPSER